MLIFYNNWYEYPTLSICNVSKCLPVDCKLCPASSKAEPLLCYTVCTQYPHADRYDQLIIMR